MVSGEELDSLPYEEGIDYEAGLDDAQLDALVSASGTEDLDQALERGLTDDELNQVTAGGSSLFFPEEGMTDEELEKLVVAQTMSGTSSEELAKGFGKGPLTAAQAANTMKAASEFYSKDSSWIDKTFYALTMGEQFVARQAVNVLENLGGLTTDEAKGLLSRDEVHGSDIVNFYWKNPENWVQKAGRFVTGLAADIALDPLSYIGIGALTQAGKTATVAGKQIKNLNKFSKTERAWFKTLESADHVIQKAGGDSSGLKALADTLESGGKIGLDDFEKAAGATPEMKELARKGLQKKSYADEWKDGERGLTIGIGIPFTRIAVETDLPKIASDVVGLVPRGIQEGLGIPKKAILSTQFGQGAWDILSDLSTRTGKFLVDVQQNAFQGGLEARRASLAAFEKQGRTIFKGVKEQLGSDEAFEKLVDDFVEELEMRPLKQAEAERVAAEFKKPIDETLDVLDDYGRPRPMDLQTIDMVKLTEQTPRDLERAASLSRFPQLHSVVDEIIDMQGEALNKFKERNIPLTELNPFGEGWARRYLKHLVSSEWLDYSKKVSRGGDAVQDALLYVQNKVGKVDPSALGRKYRGQIREANIAALEEHGVKIFVDDPFELVNRRMMEMERIVQAHDLMESATAYAVRGSNPGQGWIKFQWNDFGNLVLDESNAKFDAWKQYVPDFFKNASESSIYLPTDVYDRLLYQINGHKMGGSAKAVFQGLEAYTNLWRNNALFGPGYQGLNAASNAMTFLTYNGADAIGSLIDSARVMLGSSDNFKFKLSDGTEYALSGDQVLKEAIEDNLIRSGHFGESQFKDLAENIASNRQQRKGLWNKVSDVADVAFLWRYNRMISEHMDSLPKLATYMDRRAKGFSREAAREAADRYFYSFNVGSRGQDLVAKAIPFSRFPIKTLEAVVSELRGGHLGAMAVPAKVSEVLEGTFVPDDGTRLAIDSTLPQYDLVKDRIHGAILPGGREVMLELPWATSTINLLFNPQESLHPLAQIVFGLGSIWGATEETADIAKNDAMKMLKSNVDLVIPSYLKEALTIYDLNTGDLGGYFADRFENPMPTPDQFDSFFEGSDSRAGLNAEVQRFQNAAEFGHALQKKYGEDWLAKMFFFGAESLPDGLIKDQRVGAIGEYTRRKFRQLSLGTATMTKLDSNFIFNHWAIEKSIRRQKKTLQSFLYKNDQLLQDGALDNEGYLENIAEKHPEAKEILALKYKQNALSQYYDFILSMEAKEPNLNPIQVLFGVDDSKMDTSDAPLLWDQLTIGAGKITDEEAESALISIQQNERE